MKKTLYFIYGILIAGVLALAGYQFFIAKNFDSNSLVRLGIILVGLVISIVRLTDKGSQSIRASKKTYKEAYKDLIGTAFSDAPKQEKLLYRAIDDLQNDRYGKMLKKLNKLSAHAVRSADRFAVAFFTALCFDNTGNYRQAISYYTTALQNRENSTAASNLGLCYSRTGNEDAAIECYLRAHRANDTNPYPLNNLAQLYIRRGEYAEALDFAQQAVARNDKLTQALSAIAVCHAMMGNTAEYEQAFRRAVSNGASGITLKNYINSLNSDL